MNSHERAISASGPRPAAAAPVHLAALRLANFRNYGVLSLNLDARPVVLTGPNGAGKTNLLEAVSFLSPGRGLRRAALEEVARRTGDGAWAVAATLERRRRGRSRHRRHARRRWAGRRQALRVNHAAVRSTEALLEHLRVLWLTPAMDGLFTGPASDRRRFLDRAVLAIDRQHGTRVNAFEKAMRGRNKLLAEPGPDRAWLDAIETEMAELAVAIAAARREWAGLTAALIAAGGEAAVSRLPRSRSKARWRRRSPAGGARAVEDLYAAPPRRAAARRRGRTHARRPAPLRSPRRHAPKQMAAEPCSTGEQKALLIGLVLAQARLVARLTGETPADPPRRDRRPSRRVAARGAVRRARRARRQAFMTGTDAAVFAPLGDRAQMLAVHDGAVDDRAAEA